MTDKRSLFDAPATAHAAPAPLPFCAYPSSADTRSRGLQSLPDALPLSRPGAARAHRSLRYARVPLSMLAPDRVLQTAEVVATSFAQREPQCRHLRPPLRPHPDLRATIHTDALGSSTFGTWTRESLLYWFIRSFVLTDPASPRRAVRTNAATLEQSLAVIDDSGAVIGAALNETMPGVDAHPMFRTDDPFIDAVISYLGPVLEMLAAQDAEALRALRDRYPAFRAAHDAGRVGHHFMVARSDDLPKEHAFELVAASIDNYRDLGFAYMLVEATNQWTGAACEALGGTRVHYAPFRARPVVPAAAEAIPRTATSPTGYLSDKDSGSMLYIIRLV